MSPDSVVRHVPESAAKTVMPCEASMVVPSSCPAAETVMPCEASVVVPSSCPAAETVMPPRTAVVMPAVGRLHSVKQKA